MKILSTHRLFYLLHRYETAINDAPYMPELYEKAEEFRIAIEREVVDEALQADARRLDWMDKFHKERASTGGSYTAVRLSNDLPARAAIDAAMALDKS